MPLISSVGSLSANPFFLRFLQRLGEGIIFVRHFAQNIVACSVDNTVDAVELITDNTFGNALDDRRAGPYRGFKIQMALLFPRELKQFPTAAGDQGFVGSNNMLAALEGFYDDLFGGMKPANKLDNDVDLRIIQDVLDLFGQTGLA